MKFVLLICFANPSGENVVNLQKSTILVAVSVSAVSLLLLFSLTAVGSMLWLGRKKFQRRKDMDTKSVPACTKTNCGKLNTISLVPNHCICFDKRVRTCENPCVSK